MYNFIILVAGELVHSFSAPNAPQAELFLKEVQKDSLYPEAEVKLYLQIE